MYSIIERFMQNLTMDSVNNFALSKDIVFSNEELKFTYNFIKKNWQEIFASHGNFDINRYRNNYSKENFQKLVILYKEALQKYSSYL